uniref:Serine-threonine kinase receptor-associated protein n=1 Tax=Clastoptera arizonana TaxID=38151 RepID=A0A1B6CTR3_9HEMI
MKPISLHGHERSITQIKYNREGDLLFSCAKDHNSNVWYSLNGERLGTYNGHNGALRCLDVNWDTTRLMTGSADDNCILWDVETGSEIGRFSNESSVRTCNFSYSGNMACYTTDRRKIYMTDKTDDTYAIKDCEIFIMDVKNGDNSMANKSPILRLKVDKSQVTSMLWGPLDQTLITGHEDGTLVLWDVKMGKEICSQKKS